jgi:hypothetical protein
MEEIYINIDSRYRELNLYPDESKYKINLNSSYKNISKIKMTSIELPNLDYLPIIDPSKNNNYIIFTVPHPYNPSMQPLQIKLQLPFPLLNSDLINDDANYSNVNSSFICDTINEAIIDICTQNIGNDYYDDLNQIRFYKYKDNKTSDPLLNPNSSSVDASLDKYRKYPENTGTPMFNKIFAFYWPNQLTMYANSFSFSSTFDNNIFNDDNIDTTKTITISFVQSTQQTLSNYPSLGYYMGFRKNTYVCTMGIPTIAEEYSNMTTENYIFIKINDWGYIDVFNNKIFAKILLNSDIGDVLLNEFNNKEYIFKQPTNIQTLHIELVDYLGNQISTGGKDFSFTLQLSQILNSDNKKDIEYNFLTRKK